MNNRFGGEMIVRKKYDIMKLRPRKNPYTKTSAYGEACEASIVPERSQVSETLSRGDHSCTGERQD